MTARRFAEGTTVAVETSRAELERLVARHGAEGFVSGWEGAVSTVAWRMEGRHVRFRVVAPSPDDMAQTVGGKWRPVAQRKAAADAEHRRRWRALLLIVKAKLELVDAGDATFEEEFLAHVMLPDGSTVGEWAGETLEEVYATGQMPSLLPGSGQRALPAGGER